MKNNTLRLNKTMYTARRHHENMALIPASAEELFAYIDDHTRFSSHMSQSSWMMGGGRMDVSVDEGRGQRVGSHIRLRGTAFGIQLYLDEVVTRHEPPHLKEWETVGDLRLLVVGHYGMGIEIEPRGGTSLLRVYIDYGLPAKNAWLGRLFGRMYAKWCVGQMIKCAGGQFKEKSVAGRQVETG